METVALVLVVAVVTAAVAFRLAGRRSSQAEMAVDVGHAHLWHRREHDPAARGAGGRCPDFVDHELDLAAMRYRRIETYSNDEISAESEISVATEEFEVRRARYRDWKIRLVARNHTALSSPGKEWRDGPSAFATAWEQAWRAAGRP